MSFNYATLLVENVLVACQITSTGWKIIDPKQLPKDGGRSACVFVTGSDVTGTRLTLPLARDVEVRRALPYAIEEDIAGEIVSTHFAMGQRVDGTSKRDVRVVSNEIMERIVEQLEHYGLRNSPIYAVSDALPEDTLLDAGSYIYGRIRGRVFCLDADLPDDVILAMTRDVEDLNVCGSELASRLSRHPKGRKVTAYEDLLVYLAETLHSHETPLATDLRQGAFATKLTLSAEQMLGWKRTAALAVLSIGLWFATQLSGTRAIETHAESLKLRTSQLLASEFPEANGNFEVAVNLHSDNATSSLMQLPSVIDVSALLYKAVSEVEAAEVKSIRYDAPRNEAIGIVAVQDFSALEVLSGILEKSGLIVAAGDARQERSIVVGEFRLGTSR